MSFSIKVKPSGLPPQDLDTQKFHLLIVVLFSNCFSILISGVWPNLLAPDS